MQGAALFAAGIERPVLAVLVAVWAARLGGPLIAVALAAAATLAALPVALTQGAALASSSSGVEVLAREALRGLLLGAGAAAPLLALRSAAGWARGAFGDERPGGAVPQLFAIAAAVSFLAVDGVATAAAALVHSYTAAPLGAPLLQEGDLVAAIAGWAAIAVRLAAPLLLASAIAQLGVAVALRAAAATAESLPRAALAPSIVLSLVIALFPVLCAEAAGLWREALVR